jgi:hypothetical protein
MVCSMKQCIFKPFKKFKGSWELDVRNLKGRPLKVKSRIMSVISELYTLSKWECTVIHFLINLLDVQQNWNNWEQPNKYIFMKLKVSKLNLSFFTSNTDIVVNFLNFLSVNLVYFLYYYIHFPKQNFTLLIWSCSFLLKFFIFSKPLKLNYFFFSILNIVNVYKTK